ncbi:MAG: TetR/AcrR family transcriptional regulator [Acidimicrobiales bacterium]
MRKMSTEDRRTALAEVLVGIVAERGLDAVSVREVAAGLGVSIGAVQHYFSTKAEMLTFAFTHSVERTRHRVATLELAGDPATDTATVLRQLLPLDDTRRTDCTVNLAFAALAATTPALQAIQADLLRDMRDELAAVLGPGLEVHAAMLLATVDGLALHEVSAPGTLDPEAMNAALDAAIVAALRR